MENIEKNFNEKISKNITLVDFWAPWCGPCNMFKPIIEEVSKLFPKINFYKFNVDMDNDNICKNLGIMSIPTIILFENGNEVKRNIGFISKEELIDFLKK